MRSDLYAELPDVGNKFRAGMLAQVRALVRRRQKQADTRRRAFFKPRFTSRAAYEASIGRYRAELVAMLGWPLTERARHPRPPVLFKPIGEDRLGKIWRVWIETLPGVRTYGLFFRPHRGRRFPLVVSLHAGQGTPELCAGFFGSANYNDMTRRVLRRGIAVFAPQLLFVRREA